MQALRHRRAPQRASTNWRTTCQFQFASGMPTSAGAACTAPFSPAWASGSRAGGTAGLLEDQGRRAVALASREPPPAGVGVALQEARHLAGRPALRQQPARVPALPLARRRRARQPAPHLPCVRPPARQRRRDVRHAPRARLPPDRREEQPRHPGGSRRRCG